MKGVWQKPREETCLLTQDLIKATQIMGQRKAFCEQRIRESSSARKETAHRHPSKIQEW